MTTAHMDKMQAARKAAVQRRQNAEDDKAQAFLIWVKLEADAHAAYIDAKHYERDDDEVARLYEDWRGMVRRNPGIPTDAAMRRVRNEITTED